MKLVVLGRAVRGVGNPAVDEGDSGTSGETTSVGGYDVGVVNAVGKPGDLGVCRAAAAEAAFSRNWSCWSKCSPSGSRRRRKRRERRGIRNYWGLLEAGDKLGVPYSFDERRGIALTRNVLEPRRLAQHGEKIKEEKRKLETALHLAETVAERGQMSGQKCQL